MGMTKSLQEKRHANNKEKPPVWTGLSTEWQEQMAWWMRLAGMGYLTRLFLLSLFILAAGCSAPKAASDSTPAPAATPLPYQPGSPVGTTADAVTVAGKLFIEKGGIQWIEPPQAVFTEEMSYADAQQRLGVGKGEYDRWPAETRVWLVIFKGRWLLAPLDPNQASPTPVEYEGCGFTLLPPGMANGWPWAMPFARPIDHPWGYPTIRYPLAFSSQVFRCFDHFHTGKKLF
jgi:hypothetical protein